MDDFKENLIRQTLAMANNCIHTGRNNKAVELISAVGSMCPGNAVCHGLMKKIFPELLRFEPADDLTPLFGENWLGESLEGKSIEVFADYSIENTINLVRYLKEIKRIYDCRLVLNCYAYFNEFERLVEKLDFIDEFTHFHVKCDYHTNLEDVPAILNGQIEVDYPARFDELLKHPVPPTSFGQFDPPDWKTTSKRIGVVWQGDLNDPTMACKSTTAYSFAPFMMDDVDLYCLQSSSDPPSWINRLEINDLYDTLRSIMGMDVVITTDNAVLHLAGELNVKTLALLPLDHDPRWGTEKHTVWYPSVEIFRQEVEGDWAKPISEAKERLVYLLGMM